MWGGLGGLRRLIRLWMRLIRGIIFRRRLIFGFRGFCRRVVLLGSGGGVAAGVNGRGMC